MDGAWLPDGPLLLVFDHLSLRGLSRVLRVSRGWRALVDGLEHLWTGQFQRYAPAREYIVESLAELAIGKAHVALRKLKVKELKQIIRRERVRVQPGTLVEKKDFVDAIHTHRVRDIESNTQIVKLLKRPRLLVLGINESFPKCALRLAKEDETRTRIHPSELTTFTFHIRVRSDGPMGELTDQDPWYSNRGHGEAKFDPDGTVTFSWPFVDGVEMNPFSQMGMTNPLTLRWELEHDGAVIRILFGAQRGPQEIVCRHPVHGGWILYSMGSVWTSWEMPPCGPDGRSTDAFLWDDELHNLPSAIKPMRGAYGNPNSWT